MARLRKRYVIIDCENAQMRDIGLNIVLRPWSNPADYAAMLTWAENVDPELREDIMKLLAELDAHPDRRLGSYGKECLKHVTHPAIKPFADARLQKLSEPVPRNDNPAIQIAPELLEKP